MKRILIIGATGSSHVGGSLMRAAQQFSLEVHLCDVNLAWRHGTLWQKVLWRFGGHRPAALSQFNARVMRICDEFVPNILLSTGGAPIRADILRRCRVRQIKCVNYSTDDPFNPLQRAPWFLAALREYDIIFTPRRANIGDFEQHGCRCVKYLSFGYDPALFFPEPATEMDRSELFFAGTGDSDRAPYIAAAVEAGVDVRLHGINWNRFVATKGVTRGQADIPTLRRGISGCKVALCLVRHENRDGHSMRTFEVPAVGACMVVEDTKEHRDIFGDDGERVVYFDNPESMVNRTRSLLADSLERSRLKEAVRLWISSGANTYSDRLKTMMHFAGGLESSR